MRTVKGRPAECLYNQSLLLPNLSAACPTARHLSVRGISAWTFPLEAISRAQSLAFFTASSSPSNSGIRSGGRLFGLGHQLRDLTVPLH